MLHTTDQRPCLPTWILLHRQAQPSYRICLSVCRMWLFLPPPLSASRPGLMELCPRLCFRRRAAKIADGGQVQGGASVQWRHVARSGNMSFFVSAAGHRDGSGQGVVKWPSQCAAIHGLQADDCQPIDGSLFCGWPWSHVISWPAAAQGDAGGETASSITGGFHKGVEHFSRGLGEGHGFHSCRACSTVAFMLGARWRLWGSKLSHSWASLCSTTCATTMAPTPSITTKPWFFTRNGSGQAL